MKVLLAILLLSLAASAAAATYTVDNTTDPGNGVCDPAGGCTLREAIDAANANPGADIIAFNIPGGGVSTITPDSPLPDITEAVTIDGYTQPGTSENTLPIGDDAVLLIELNGTNAGLTHGLTIFANGCTIRGLVINRYFYSGITTGFASADNVIEGNFIGIDPSGTFALGNGQHAVFIGGPNNLVGGPSPAARNILSANLEAGVAISGDGEGNLVQGNYIGTNKNGTADLGNGSHGVWIAPDSPNNQIGDELPGAGNLISGNGGNGVFITSLGNPSISPDNVVAGNIIGLDATGATALPNDGNGIEIDSENDNLIGGTATGARNLISGNGGDGILIINSATGNTVLGNYIGTDITGTVALGNNLSGIAIEAASDNIIGGVTIAARNLISANGTTGVVIRDGATANMVQGNYIGTDLSGNSALGNIGTGMAIVASLSNTVGGAAPGAGNLLSGNSFGVQIAVAGATGNVVQGNLIGTDAAGFGAVPNGFGILLFVDCLDTTVGGPGSAGNTIAFNLLGGLAVNPASSGGTVFGNSIFSNGGLGIDLAGGIEDANLVTANDFPDSDTGANNLQNYPTIGSITASGTDRTVEGELASNPNTDYTLDFYSNSEVDPSGYGEGETYLGFLNVQTNAQGRVNFTYPLAAGSYGRFITATATDPDGNTSEFSKASEIVPSLNRFQNISTRLRVQTGDSVLIGGFIITGNDAKEILLRAIGPSLGEAGVAGPLGDPVIELHYPDNATVVTNDNWRDTQEAEIIATGIPPTNNKESAIVATLDPGAYTAIVRGANGGSGVALVEAYDLDQAANSTLANISTRGFVQTGDNVMIGGIIVGPGDAPEGSVLLRAIGPSLTDLGVPDAMADPMLDLHDANGALIASNNNWKSTQQAAIEATGVPPNDDKESAILATLAPGNYTAIVSGAGGATGVGLVEAYHLE